MDTNAASTTKIWFDNSECNEIISQENTTYCLREMKDERRAGTRHTVTEGTYAVIESINPQICQILNISSTGMAFEYFKGEEDSDFIFDKLDIMVLGSGFCLENIFFEKVSDFRVESVDTCGFEKRIANINFMDLTETRLEKINEFILNHVNKVVN